MPSTSVATVQAMLQGLFSQSGIEQFDMHHNGGDALGSNKSGFGSHALLNSAGIRAKTPGTSSVLDPAICFHH